MIEQLLADLKEFSGLQRKKGIKSILKTLKSVSALGFAQYSLGDDAAVIKNGSEYLLLAAEEISRDLLKSDPWWAGFCAVLTNVNDIYSMGGVPLALVNTVSFTAAEQGEKILQGMAAACEKYGVPMVGGHFTPENDCATLSAAVLGKAQRVLTSFDAQNGDQLIVAVELEGRQYKDFPNWDCISDKTAAEIKEKLEPMLVVAEKSLAHGAKDISNAGIIGTVCMLLETSEKGAKISIEKIPVPESIDLRQWLKMYPSYGFILSVPPENEKEVTGLFSEKKYAVASVGTVNDSSKVVLRYRGKENDFVDFSQESLF